MGIKPNQSGSRILTILEAIARHQPVGVSELARLLVIDKSAVQRAIVTLDGDGWIRAALGKPTRWEVTARIHMLAHDAIGGRDLRRRARGALEALRDETKESVVLSALVRDHFIAIDVLDGAHYLRTSLPLGFSVPAKGSLSARAMLPYLRPDQQQALLGEPPNETMLEEFAASVDKGYWMGSGELGEGSIIFAAPIFEVDGRPVAVVLLSAPKDGTPQDRYPRLGEMVSATARRLSLGIPTVHFNLAKGAGAHH